MECDMLVALSRATTEGGTLFGHNCNRRGGEDVALLRVPGRAFAPGETVSVGPVTLPQVRRTWTVLAGRYADHWGYQHGLNEHGVSLGVTTIHTRRRAAKPALTGPDLARLALERAASARQAVEVVTDLASRHGQGTGEEGRDAALLLADGREAYVVEMFGGHWAVQQVGAVRAVSAVCHLRQDWDQLSPGLADLAIAQGWWPANGSKLDFAGAVAADTTDTAALRRWGWATLLLEQHQERIDLPLLRRVLSDHDAQASWCRHANAPAAPRTVASLITQCGPGDTLPVAWCSFGPPCQSVYVPFLLVGELPAPWQAILTQSGGRARRPADQDALASLQKRYERETGEFVAEAAELRRRGEAGQLPRLAELFMQHVLECWENVNQELEARSPRAGSVALPRSKEAEQFNHG
jgi:dipeptidase